MIRALWISLRTIFKSIPLFERERIVMEIEKKSKKCCSFSIFRKSGQFLNLYLDITRSDIIRNLIIFDASLSAAVLFSFRRRCKTYTLVRVRVTFNK